MYTLGISCYYHDSAAAILKDGEIIAAIEEERFSRKKFDDGFPKLAINWCLEQVKLLPNEINSVAFYDKPVLKFERLLDNYIAVAPRGLSSFLDIIPKWIHRRLWIKDEIKKNLKGFNGKIIFPEHHISHAAYAFFTSPFTESAILTVDGVGEWSTTGFGMAHDTKIEITHDIRWPHSLGLFYSAFTYFLGFKVNEGEYKLMGLSAYGKPAYYDLILDELIDVKNDGSIHLNMEYFAFTYDKVMTNQNFSNLFGIQPRKEGQKMEQIHYDIAASAQLALEDILLKLERVGVQSLRNATAWFRDDVQIVGIDDKDDPHQVEKQLDKIEINSSAFTLLLYHRPQGLVPAGRAGVQLMLSGHTHNGQIFPFNLLVARVFEQVKGLFSYHGAHLYVSQGTGTWGPVLRLGTRAEITWFQLRPIR